MVTTRSQSRASAAARSAEVQKKAKVIVLNQPTYQYFVGGRTVNLYKLDQETLKTQNVSQSETNTNGTSGPLTRSRAKKIQQQQKVNDWKIIAYSAIENIKQATSVDDRKAYWVKSIRALLEEQENQNGENCVENKVIIMTQIYKILSYMLNKHFMDFKTYESFWRTTEKKTKEMLIEIEKHNKKGKINNETYLEAKKMLHEVQTFQIMFDDLVFPVTSNYPFNTPK